MSLTCPPCLGAQHRKCSGDDCACSVCARSAPRALKPRPSPPKEPTKRPQRGGLRKGARFTRQDSMTDAQVALAFTMRTQGKTWREIGEATGHCYSGVRKRLLKDTGGVDPCPAQAVRAALRRHCRTCECYKEAS